MLLAIIIITTGLDLYEFSRVHLRFLCTLDYFLHWLQLNWLSPMILFDEGDKNSVVDEFLSFGF